MTDAELERVREEFIRLREKVAPLVADDIGHIEQELDARKQRH
jgi:hypothetical protein